jgi:hypothetical protein
VSFDQIFLTLLLAGWAICGAFPWLVSSVLTRGTTGLVFLPVSMAVAVVFALLVPFLGATGTGGLWASFIVAFAAPAALLSVRRFALHLPATPTSAGSPVKPGETHSSK